MSTAHATDAKTAIIDLLTSALKTVAPDAAGTTIALERPKQTQHGDFSCNVAMQLAKTLRAKPRDIAQKLLAALPPSPLIEKTEIAGAGFINLFLARSYKKLVLNQILTLGAEFGKSSGGAKQKIQIEFVSANPTGPLHVGHGRGAAYGACVANVLSATGHEVTREFYINDAGRQMDILAASVWLRFLEARGIAVAFPADGYRGDYVRDIARALDAAHGAQLQREFPTIAPAEGDDADAALDALIARAKTTLGESWWLLHKFALDAMLADQRDDLTQFGVSYDRWFSERSLYDSGEVARAVESLQRNGHLYEKDGALWFRSTTFGDEKDRVVRRENGQYTYFASDIAYHLNKIERGYDQLIDVWGADHHGYIARVKGALKALGADPNKLIVPLVQFAVLYRGGEKVAMGKRSGDFVTLRELREEVGEDATRFFYVLRKSDQHLDFDLDLAKSRTNENPVYYIQYAHARVCSVYAQWGGDAATLTNADPAPLASETELELLQKLAEYPEIVGIAARELSPHLIAFYLKDLAAQFHSYYNNVRFLADDTAERDARLALAGAVRQVLANGLALLGVSAPEKM
ncbi:MAG TPA: arginine--tRNA ligase [Burkholderiales bacterium]|nr:arginine--tRNA ligase [Burkholderiales bacterium]